MAPEKFAHLLELMARLRAPGGCPWDREQTLQSLRRYLIEETYEVLDAIEREDWQALPEELGDLQLQIVFQSEIAAEAGLFTISDVLDRINGKLIRRHPHVFGSESAATAGDVKHRWDEIKAAEKAERPAGHDGAPASILDHVAEHQPALLEAEQIGKKAAQAGFDWKQFEDLLDKLAEEREELREAAASADPRKMEDEVGDLLFVAVNVARHLKVNPELALKRTNRKFRERFRHVEQELMRSGRSLDAASLDEMEALWQAAKQL